MSPTGQSLLQKIEAKTAAVGVIGLGYVGLPLAVAAAERGFHVTGFDTDPRKVELLDARESYIEAVSSEAIENAAVSGRFRYTVDLSRLAECDVVVICVPTPLSPQREPDLSYVEKTAETIAHHMTAGTLVVLESTTFPGTTDEILVPILQKSGLVLREDFFVGFSPEREDPGNAKFRTTTIPKVVAGDGELASRMVASFYASIVDVVVPVSDTRTAEAVKITENIFRAVNIALVNELKVIYSAMGIDIWEVIDAAATKPFGFMPFYPGPGLGGHCVPIDPFYLTWKAREYDVSTRFIELAGEINTEMPRYVIARLREVLDRHFARGLRGARVLVVGLAYKKNVSDTRESPSLKLMAMLADEGSTVDYLDLHVPVIPTTRHFPQLAGRESVTEAEIPERGYHAILIATDHDNIDYGRLVDLRVPILDTRNAIARRGLSLELVAKA